MRVDLVERVGRRVMELKYVLSSWVRPIPGRRAAAIGFHIGRRISGILHKRCADRASTL